MMTQHRLKDAHAALDTAYGFNAKKDLLAQLLALNQQVASKIEKGEPIGADRFWLCRSSACESCPGR